jgi:hypothetical protein
MPQGAGGKNLSNPGSRRNVGGNPDSKLSVKENA